MHGHAIGWTIFFLVLTILDVAIIIAYLITIALHRRLFQINVRNPTLMFFDLTMQAYLASAFGIRQVAAEIGFKIPYGFMKLGSFLLATCSIAPFTLRYIYMTIIFEPDLRERYLRYLRGKKLVYLLCGIFSSTVCLWGILYKVKLCHRR